MMCERSWALQTSVKPEGTEMLMNPKAQWSNFFVVIKCFFVRKCSCIKCSFWLFFFCIKRNQENNNMIEIHVHHLCRNKNKYSRDQLMNCYLPHCFHNLSADRLLAVTLLQFMPLSLTLIHTHTHIHTHTYCRVLGCRSWHTLQPRWKQIIITN